MEPDTVSFQLIHPFTMEIIGPTSCGKSHLISRIIQNRRECINEPIDKVLYIYSHFQPLYANLQESDPNITFSSRIEDIEEHAQGQSLQVIIDDWMDELKPRSKPLELVTRYFIKSCHHMSKLH